jgi:hypothetical protein
MTTTMQHAGGIFRIIKQRERIAPLTRTPERDITMTKFLLWLILLFLCWPLALMALVMYPVVWLLLLPFRLLGIAVDGVLELFRFIILLPTRIFRGTRTT